MGLRASFPVCVLRECSVWLHSAPGIVYGWSSRKAEHPQSGSWLGLVAVPTRNLPSPPEPPAAGIKVQNPIYVFPPFTRPAPFLVANLIPLSPTRAAGRNGCQFTGPPKVYLPRNTFYPAPCYTFPIPRWHPDHSPSWPRQLYRASSVLPRLPSRPARQRHRRRRLTG